MPWCSASKCRNVRYNVIYNEWIDCRKDSIFIPLMSIEKGSGGMCSCKMCKTAYMLYKNFLLLVHLIMCNERILLLSYLNARPCSANNQNTDLFMHTCIH